MTDKKKSLTAAQRADFEHSRRLRQTKTMRKKHGADYFKRIGSKGGQNSTTQWDSDTARKMAERSWEIRRQKAAEKAKSNENGLPTNEQK